MIHTIVTYDPSGNVSDTITLDCVKSYTESYTATATTNTVESGTNITDDITHDQDKFAISGIVSDYAFRRKGFKVTFLNGEFVKDTTEEDRDTREETPTIYIKDTLRRIIREGEIVRLIRSTNPSNPTENIIDSYFPCVFTSLTISDLSDGAIDVNINLQKIEVAQVVFKTLDKATRRLIPFVKPKEEKAKTSEGTGLGDSKVGSKEAPPKDESTTGKKEIDKQALEEEKLRKEEIVANDLAARVWENPDFTKDQNARIKEYARLLTEVAKFPKDRVIFWLKKNMKAK